MASQSSDGQPISPQNETSFPAPQPTQPEHAVARSASIVSSRMTDVASDDGAQGNPPKAAPKSSSKAAQNARRNYIPPTKRVPNTAATAKAGRSHVPSLTSNAFFRPMSSQKLQAQRAAAARPAQSTLEPVQAENLDDGMTDAGGSVVGSYQPARSPVVPRSVGAEESNRPKSHTTEMTDQEAIDRATANTSPTPGHYPADSLSESVKPLYNRGEIPQNWVNNDDKKAYRDVRDVRQSNEKRRSFRSSFLLPGRAESGGKRSTDGAEKLYSAASSPRLGPTNSRPHPHHATANGQAQIPANGGRVHEYFDGNTIFCLGGRWQNTKHRPVNIATGIFVVIPCILFFVFEASWLWHNVSPALPIIFAYLAYVCTSSFIHASVSDPGVSLPDQALGYSTLTKYL